MCPHPSSVTRLAVDFRPHPAICLREILIEGDQLTVLLDGQIIFTSAGPLREYLQNQTVDYAPQGLVLDCQRVTFVDSEGLAMLVGLDRHCRQHQISMKLIRPGQHLARLLKMTRLDQYLVIG